MFRPVSCKPRENAFDEASNFEINRDQFRLTGTDIVHPGKILIDDRRLTRQCDEEGGREDQLEFVPRESNLVSFDKFAIVVPWKETNVKSPHPLQCQISVRSGNHWNLFHQRALDFRFLHGIPYRFPLFYRLWIYGPLPFILPFSLLSLAYRARWSRNNWLVISLQVTSSAGECTRIFSTFLGLLGGILIMIVIIEIDWFVDWYKLFRFYVASWNHVWVKIMRKMWKKGEEERVRVR